MHWTVLATDGQDTVAATNNPGWFYFGIEGAADDPASALPYEFALSAYPNPFNPTTTLSISLPVSSEATLRVFDVNGRLVREMSLGRLAGGIHEISFDGSELPSGIYLAALKAGHARAIQKLVLLK